MRFLLLNLLFLFNNEVLYSQLAYNEHATQPIGNNIREILITRYNFEKRKQEGFPKRDTIIKINTVISENGTPKIDTETVIREMYSQPEFQYPDTAIVEKKVYNKKGLLIYKEDPYHIHVDWPLFKADSFSYDNKNRRIAQKVCKTDSFNFYRSEKITYIDSIRTIKNSLIEDNIETALLISRFDGQNRRMQSVLYTDNSLYQASIFQYCNHGRSIIQLMYNDTACRELDEFTCYEKDSKGRKIEESCYRKDSVFYTGHFYLYDKKGNLIQDKWLNDEDRKIIQIVDYEYDPKGNLIIEKYRNERTIQYVYRKDNLLDYKEEYNENNQLIAKYKYDYKFWQ